MSDAPRMVNPHAKARGVGLTAAVLMLLVDQAHKLWMLNVFDMPNRQPVRIAPFFDLVMAWNRGASYSLLEADSELGRYGLLVLTLGATALMAWWLWRATHVVGGLGLGLIIGGAIGNAIDRAAYGAVADFFHFHLGSFSWYVFNLADVGIVAGVALLLYESFLIAEKKPVA